MAEARFSLRRRLLALLVAATGAVWIAIAAATFVDARFRAEELFDAQLQEYSEVLSALGNHEAGEIAGTTTSLEHGSAPGLSYQVYAAGGPLLMLSHAAPEAPLAAADGFGESQHGGKRWRVFRRTDTDNHLVIIVAQDMAVREAVIRNIATWVLVPLVIGLPLLAAALWIAVSRSMVPLDQLAADVRRRKPDTLEPMHAPRAPVEVQPLVDALNQLFARLERSFENERRFTGDAAHELRTPLAALKTQAQLALTAASDERRRRALEQVVAGVDRATRLVEELLALARLDAARLATGEEVDVAEVAREAADELAGEARSREVAVSHLREGASAARVRGNAPMLHALARNLVENAIRHAPRGGEVRVSVRDDPGGVVLTVADSGPGVPDEQRERIFDRFFRLASADTQGSGLGLSIARRVVELHAGSIRAEKSRDLEGLAVVATLPAER